MSETAPSGDGAPVEGSNDRQTNDSDKFSFNSIAQFLSDLSRRAEHETPEMEAIEKADSAFDDAICSKTQSLFERKIGEGEIIAEDPARVADLLGSLRNWSVRFAQKLKPEALEGLTTVFRMISSALSGEYVCFSKSTIACLIGAALYCVSPIDVIPDAIPLVGLVDDGFVLAWTIKKVAGELQSFRAWERLKAAKSLLASYLPYFDSIKRVVLIPGWVSENDPCVEVASILAPVYPNASFETFKWPSNQSWDDAKNYVDGKGQTELLERLHDLGDLSTVAVVGHSLGARMLAKALAVLAKEPEKKSFWARKATNRVGQAFLLGAAIDVDDPALETAGLGAASPLCNFFNCSDRVLSYLYRAREHKTPLGLAGMPEQRPNYVDCMVSGNEEYWLGVADNVASVLTLLQSKSFLTKFSLSESLASGLPEYWKHQFKLYAQFFKDSTRVKEEN